MVRVNIINPKYLTDQHLVAEYLEIMMLTTYAKRHPCIDGVPKRYCLGAGHQKFFKNKLLYLKKRHELLKKEMRQRGFKTNVTLKISDAPKHLLNDWSPRKDDFKIIRKRLLWKLNKKPKYYRYYGEHKKLEFLLSLTRKSK